MRLKSTIKNDTFFSVSDVSIHFPGSAIRIDPVLKDKSVFVQSVESSYRVNILSISTLGIEIENEIKFYINGKWEPTKELEKNFIVDDFDIFMGYILLDKERVVEKLNDLSVHELSYMCAIERNSNSGPRTYPSIESWFDRVKELYDENKIIPEYLPIVKNESNRRYIEWVNEKGEYRVNRWK